MDPEEQKVLQYADDLYRVAMAVLAAAEVTIQGRWNRDPKVVGLTILSRSLSIFKSALLLVRANQVLEAKMLARPMYENLLWIAALRERVPDTPSRSARKEEGAPRRPLVVKERPVSPSSKPLTGASNPDRDLSRIIRTVAGRSLSFGRARAGDSAEADGPSVCGVLEIGSVVLGFNFVPIHLPLSGPNPPRPRASLRALWGF